MSIDGPGGIKNIRKNREFFQPMKRERILSPQNLELFATLQSTTIPCGEDGQPNDVATMFSSTLPSIGNCYRP
jgi:hypothetical protein